MRAAQFFTDEDIYAAVAPALRNTGVDAVSTPEAGRLCESDERNLPSPPAAANDLVRGFAAAFETGRPLGGATDAAIRCEVGRVAESLDDAILARADGLEKLLGIGALVRPSGAERSHVDGFLLTNHLSIKALARLVKRRDKVLGEALLPADEIEQRRLGRADVRFELHRRKTVRIVGDHLFDEFDKGRFRTPAVDWILPAPAVHHLVSPVRLIKAGRMTNEPEAEPGYFVDRLERLGRAVHAAGWRRVKLGIEAQVAPATKLGTHQVSVFQNGANPRAARFWNVKKHGIRKDCGHNFPCGVPKISKRLTKGASVDVSSASLDLPRRQPAGLKADPSTTVPY